MAGEVTLRTTLARPFLAATNTPQIAYLLVELQPSQIVANVRMPVNVCFVLDRSGSMKGDKIERVRLATSMALDMLNQQDTFSVVIFDHRTEVLLPAQTVQNPADLKATINRIRDAGGTKIAPAIEKGLQEIAKDKSDTIRRMVLLTDGQTEHEDECLLRAEDAGRVGVPITALGTGNDWNEDLLIDMANRSNGIADFIDRPDKISEFFQTTVQRAQAAVVRNTTFTMRLVQGIAPRALWQVIPMINDLGYKYITDRDITIPLGELENGQGQMLMIEMLIEPHPVGQYRAGQIEVCYDVPSLNLVQETLREDVLLTFTADQKQINQVNAPIMNVVEKVSAFKLQTRALQDLQLGDVGGATQKLKSAVTRLLNQGETDLAKTMQQEISNLEQSGKLSSEGQKTIKFGTRKTVRLSDLDLPKDLS
jgi:Ca-activated chloride channel homolog